MLSLDRGQAEELSSRWVIDQYTKSRLFIGGYDKERKILHMGWQISLKEGWKTYWRSPGAAGLPPRWHWKAQENIRSIQVNWPLPEKLNIFDMDTYIYHDEVILPIEVTVIDDQKPLSLSLDLEFMICEEVCIPLEGSYELQVKDLGNAKVSLYQQALLKRYADLVPQKISGEKVKITKTDGEKLWRIELPQEFYSVDTVILEGPEGVMLAPLEEIGGQDKKIYLVRYDMEEGVHLSGKNLILTLVLPKKIDQKADQKSDQKTAWELTLTIP